MLIKNYHCPFSICEFLQFPAVFVCTFFQKAIKTAQNPIEPQRTTETTKKKTTKTQKASMQSIHKNFRQLHQEPPHKTSTNYRKLHTNIQTYTKLQKTCKNFRKLGTISLLYSLLFSADFCCFLSRCVYFYIFLFFSVLVSVAGTKQAILRHALSRRQQVQLQKNLTNAKARH